MQHVTSSFSNSREQGTALGFHRLDAYALIRVLQWVEFVSLTFTAFVFINEVGTHERMVG